MTVRILIRFFFSISLLFLLNVLNCAADQNGPPYKLKPRLEPTYEQFKDAIWDHGWRAVPSMLVDGWDPNLKSDEGRPILLDAPHDQMVEMLLVAGADPNASDRAGSLLLGSAIRDGNKNLADLLLKYGADPKLEDIYGGTLIDLARRSGRDEILKLLETPRPVMRPKPIPLPVVLRRPTISYGGARFTAASGGRAIAYSPCGKQIATGVNDGTVRFFDALTGEIQNVIPAHSCSVMQVAYIPKSRILVSTDEDRLIRFWDIDTSKKLGEMREDKCGGYALAVSPDGKYLTNGLYLWKIESVMPLKVTPACELKYLSPRWVFFTPDSRFLILGRGGRTEVHLWDLAAHKVFVLKNFEHRIPFAMTWSDLTCAADIGTAKPTDVLAISIDPNQVLTGPSEILRAFAPHMRKCDKDAEAWACSPDGQYVATFGSGPRIRIYDTKTGERKYKQFGHDSGVYAVASSPCGRLIASSGWDNVRIWDRRTGNQLEEIEGGGSRFGLNFSPDGKLLAYAGGARFIFLWDVVNRKRRTYFIVSSGRGSIGDVIFSPNSRYLAAVNFDLMLFDLTTGEMIAKDYADRAQQGNIDFSPDGKLIVGKVPSVSAGETFKVPHTWSFDGKELKRCDEIFTKEMGHRSMIFAVTFSPQGDLLAAASEKVIRFWDMRRRKSVGETPCGHTRSINDLKFSPCGKWIASCSWDGTARVWEVATGAQKILIDPDVYRISTICFTPDGKLLTANWDGTVHLYDWAAAVK